MEVSRESGGDRHGMEFKQPVQTTVDPIVTMFKGVKRNVKFDINIEISDKIPRLDFIEMMEDSYEISLIDFLADEFTNKILDNPNIIKDTIIEKIKLLVYGAPNIKPVQEKIQTKEKIVDEEDKVSETTKPLAKLSATQRVKAISKLTTVEMVKKALLGEKAKSVKEAGSKRIEELEQDLIEIEKLYEQVKSDKDESFEKGFEEGDRKSTRLNSSHITRSRMPSSA